MTDKTPSRENLEDFFINNNNLEKLDAHLSVFNPIRLMRMENMEIRHSTILSWLLDPQETHGFGDLFLKAFLSGALKGQSEKEGGISAIDVHLADLSDAEVRREWKNIDIFIKSETKKWIFIVENKVRSKQHSGQLNKYKERISKNYPGFSQQGIFLTLDDETPEDDSYVQIYYLNIKDILSQLIERRKSNLDENVLYFLKFYINTLDSLIGGSSMQKEMESLARQLYLEHKKVIDFIYEHGIASKFNIAMQDLFGELNNSQSFTNDGCEYLHHKQTDKIFSFIPKQWVDAIGGKIMPWTGCENWWAGYPLILWFDLTTGNGGNSNLTLHAEVGPLKVRNSLIEAIKNSNCTHVRFGKMACNEDVKYSKFLKNNSHQIKDTQDIEELKEKTKKLLNELEPDFKKITENLKAWRSSVISSGSGAATTEEASLRTDSTH